MPFRSARVRPGDPAQRKTEPHRMLPAESRFADAWSSAVRTVSREVPIGQIERAISRGDHVDSLYDFVKLERRLNDAVEAALLPEYVDSARAALDDLGMLRKAEDVSLTFSFDQTNPLATEYSRARAGEFVAQVSTETRQAVRQVVTRSFSEGLTRRETSRLLRSVGVGLHERYAQAVVSHHQSAAARLARIHPGWSPDRVAREAEQQASRYADRLKRSRARTIARTEIQIASNQGKMGGWQEAVNQGALDPSVMQREWRTGPASLSGISPCDICVPMHGQRVAFNEPFSPSTGSRMMPPAHPNCRCTAVVVPVGAASNPGVL